ncbi:hypothetical protein HanIR_Chr16g0811101 [Helianthus annuus]|nr:hypothetical protein HanIR_Chr16g0811101 [Helianthus annuus]
MSLPPFVPDFRDLANCDPVPERTANHVTMVRTPPTFYFRNLHTLKKQTHFFLQTVEVWSNSSSTDVCRCGPQTSLKKQTTPY